MLRYFAPSIAFLVALSGNSTSANARISTAQSDSEADPPEDMIDFLGRRKECADFAPELNEALPAPPAGSWREWLRCDTLGAEEQALRRRYGSDRQAIAFLNQAPRDFRLQTIIVNTYDGPPPGKVEHAEQRGFDSDGRISWQMILDRKAAEGRATAVTVSWGSYPSRTIYLDNQMFPWLDLTSAWVAIRERPYEALSIEIRYGPYRGWCGDTDRDDRSRVDISFKPNSADVSRQDRANCNVNYEEVEASAFAAPPPTLRR